MPRNISPTTAQRAALGSVVKMLQDPLSYKQLLLFGSQGCLICADHTVSSPKWRAVRLSATSDLTWTQTFDFTASDGGWTLAIPFTLGSYSGGMGWVSTLDSSFFSPFWVRGVQILKDLPSPATITSFTAHYTITLGTLDTGSANRFGTNNTDDLANQYQPATGGGTLTLSWSGSETNVTQLHLYLLSSIRNGADGGGSVTLTSITVKGTGLNPFGGSGGGSGNITYFGDMVGSINKKGWFGWLGQDGTDVWFYYTTNYFQTRKRVNVAAYDSNKVYTISVGFYGNSTTKGVVLVTAGTSVYKSTNYGVSFSDLSIAVNDSGGSLVVPFAKNGGAVNAGTSPQYLLVKGVSTNLQARSLAGGTVTLASGSSHVPIGPYSLNVFKQDGAYCWCIMSDGTFYTSVDGGGTWSAQATPTHVGTVYGATGSPKNLAFALAFGNECLAYSADSGAAWTSLYSSYRTWADANIGSGKAQTIVTALVDLALLYSKPVSQ